MHYIYVSVFKYVYIHVCMTSAYLSFEVLRHELTSKAEEKTTFEGMETPRGAPFICNTQQKDRVNRKA